MRQDQLEELMKAAEKGDYMSIGISGDDRPFGGCFVPWEKTGTAMNMKLPRVMITPKDLENADIREAMRKCRLVGCYIFTALSDYSFLSELKKLRDIFIMHGENIKDIEFVRPLTDLFMFYIEEAHIPTLAPLAEACSKEDSFPGKCFGFYRCRVEDTSALEDIDFIMSELIVWGAEGDRRDRWKMKKRKPSWFRYYR